MAAAKAAVTELTAAGDAWTRELSSAMLDRAIPLREQIYQIVRRAIVTGSLKPGEPIDEIAIAERLGLSRTPVREAVRKISDEGLVEIRAQSGTYVAAISRGQVEEAYIIRTALELESVARAAPAITQRHIDNLEDIVDRHDKSFKRQLFAEAFVRDDEFHRYIAEINGLSTLWKVVDISKAQMDRCRHIVGSSGPHQANRTIAQHRAIVRALRTGDRRQSLQAMREHLQSSLEHALRLLEAAPPCVKSASSPQKSPD